MPLACSTVIVAMTVALRSSKGVVLSLASLNTIALFPLTLVKRALFEYLIFFLHKSKPLQPDAICLK